MKMEIWWLLRKQKSPHLWPCTWGIIKSLQNRKGDKYKIFCNVMGISHPFLESFECTSDGIFNTEIHFATEACLWYIFTNFLINIHTNLLVGLLMSLPTWSTSNFIVSNRFKAHEYPMKQWEIYQKYDVQLE